MIILQAYCVVLLYNEYIIASGINYYITIQYIQVKQVPLIIFSSQLLPISFFYRISTEYHRISQDIHWISQDAQDITGFLQYITGYHSIHIFTGYHRIHKISQDFLQYITGLCVKMLHTSIIVDRFKSSKS